MQSETVLAASVENVRKCQENDKQSSWRASGKQKNMFQSSLSESITLAFKHLLLYRQIIFNLTQLHYEACKSVMRRWE